MMKSWKLPCVVAVVLACVGRAGAAEAFPTRPVRIVVNSSPGGLLDVTTRMIAQKMGENLGQAVIVENRPGGDGLVGIRVVKASAPDGYTLLATAGTIAIQPAVKVDPGYDLLKDFTGIGPTVRSPTVLVVGASSPDKTLADFIARAKANPNKITYASAGVGSTTHVGAARFLQSAGLELVHVPYKGNGAAMPDVMAARVAMIFEAPGSGMGKIKEGLLRALAISSTARIPALPNVPTFAEQGVTNFSYYLWLGFVAPAGLKKEVVERLSDALRKALASPELNDRLRNDGGEAMFMPPGEFNEFLKTELTAMNKLATDLKIEKQ